MRRVFIILLLITSMVWLVGATRTVPTGVGAWKTWTPVFGGFSVDPPVNAARYTQTGKKVTARMQVADGTSSSNIYTVTLPVAASSTAKQYFAIGPIFNNSITPTTPGMLVTRTGSTTADLFLDMASTVWSTSGGQHANFTITYETN